MRTTPVRAIFSATAVAVLLAFPVPAAETTAPSSPTVKEELSHDPQVKESQQPEPSPQGIRSPEPLPTNTDPVARTLNQAERTPTNVAGEPVPRPNGLSSLPEKIAAQPPDQPGLEAPPSPQ
ncbi:MAG TPA: hypothetical protein VEB64_01770 [Azospirillaceae bacterium]|nr:hypothetical protein [Azospirillaceae bacterium]